MGLFEVQRVLEAWPSLRNAQALRELLRREDGVEGVWLLQGHVVISCFSKESGNRTVHLFDQVPLNKLSDSSNQFGISSELVDVLAINESHIALVCFSGVVHMMKFSRDTYQWKNCGLFYLDSSALVTRAMMSGCNQIIYCVQQGTGDWCYSVHVQTLVEVDASYQLSNHTHLLSNCPLVKFLPVSTGIWVVPDPSMSSPPNLMVYWGSEEKSVKVHVFSNGAPTPTCGGDSVECFPAENDLDGIRDFRILCRKTAWKWAKSPEGGGGGYVVSLCVHPVSHYLMVLMSHGAVYQVKWTKDCLQCRCLVILKDFTKRYPTPKPWFASSTTTGSSVVSHLQLFVCHTYCGLCHHGELRLYDSATGEFIWECDDLDHISTKMVTTPIATPHCIPMPVVLWNQSGIYLLRCKRIADHASMFVESLFPVTTNADETTPGDYLKNGELYAAHTCNLWGLSLLATHYTVTLAYQLLKGENQDCTVPSLQPELIKELDNLFIQSPALCVALMAQYPDCHKFLVDHLTDYLEEINEDNSAVQAALNAEAVPLLKQYLELSQQYEMLLTTATTPVDNTPLVKNRVREIMEISQQSIVSADPTVDLRAEFSYLSSSYPSETLTGIKEYMNIQGSFADTFGSDHCCADLNWKNLFASEVADKASQTSLKPSIQSARLPVFETICILLYQLDPDDLIHFVEYAHMVRESQQGDASFIKRTLKKEYFYQRAVDSINMPNEKSTSSQIQTFCQLCLLSNKPNAELEALSVLLKAKMWSDAIELMKKVKPKVTPPLHSAMFHRSMIHFSEGGMLYSYLDQLWDLLPKTFSILDFIDVLKSLKHEGEGDVLTSNEQLSIADISPYILHLLLQENEHKKVV